MNPTRLVVIPTTEILANVDERTITGCLVPFGEVGQTNAGPIIVEAEHIDLPADPVVIGLNLDHGGPRKGIGHAVKVWKEAQGIMATFAIAKTPAGDAALADALDPNGKRRALSGEFDVVLGQFDTTVNARRSMPGGILWGGASVERGAFPSARVLAELAEAVPSEFEAPERASSSRYVSEFKDEDGATWRRVEENVSTTTVTKVTDDPEADPAEDTEEKGSDVTEQQETVQAGYVPGTMIEGGPAVLANRLPTLQTIAAALVDVKTHKSKAAQSSVEVLAALSDLTLTGAGSLPGAALQPNWMGLIAEGVTYVQEYITLFNPGTEIYAGGKKGYKLRRGTAGAPLDAPLDGSWAGNKQPVKSYQGFTETHGSVLDRWAIAEDIGREFYDLPGGMEFVVAFLQFLQEDYLVWQDDLALAYAVAAAGAPTAPDVSKYPTNYPAALGHLIQGILRVKRRKPDGRRDTPTFAVMNDIDYEELIYAAGGEQNLPAFVNIALSTSGNGTVDGNVEVVNGDIGIEETGATLVGASYAIDFDRPAGGLLEVDALDLARGGVDKGAHGYLQTFVKRPEALELIGTADA